MMYLFDFIYRNPGQLESFNFLLKNVQRIVQHVLLENLKKYVLNGFLWPVHGLPWKDLKWDQKDGH